MANEIKDSGATREFETGSHRDMSTGKGRMDLLPATSVIHVYQVVTATETSDNKLSFVDYLKEALVSAMHYMAGDTDKDYLAIAARASTIATGLFESIDGDLDGNKVEGDNIEGYLAFGLKQISMHYEAGAIKYGENNWQLGQPMHVLLDSGMRHMAKAIGKITDEPHCRASAWNMLSAIWMEKNKPEMQDISSRMKNHIETNQSDLDLTDDDVDAFINSVPTPQPDTLLL